jgi:hypothetical protein
MQKRPLTLIVASCIFLFSPISLINEFLLGKAINSVDWLLSGLLPLGLCVGLLRVNRIAWYTLFGFVFLWGVRDLHGLQNTSGNLIQVLLNLFIYTLSLTYFINPRIKRLYFDPRLQWWRTKIRYETHGPAIIEVGTKTHYPTLKNISEGGCFLETPHTQEQSEQILITIPLPSPVPKSSLKLIGEVRWVSSQPEKMGMGIQFLSLSKEDRINLKKFVAQH